jgi:hypothetical protein
MKLKMDHDCFGEFEIAVTDLADAARVAEVTLQLDLAISLGECGEATDPEIIGYAKSNAELVAKVKAAIGRGESINGDSSWRRFWVDFESKFRHKPTTRLHLDVRPGTDAWLHLWDHATMEGIWNPGMPIDRINYVGSDDQNHYFQERGNTDGLAAISRTE